MKKSFVRKLVAVISAMVMSVAAMATTANAAAPSGGGASAGTNGFITENNIPMFEGSYSLKKEPSGTHYNLYSTSNYALAYTSAFYYDKLLLNCTTFSCTVSATSSKCYMGCRTYVTAGQDKNSNYVGNGFSSKYLYDSINTKYVGPYEIETRAKSGQYLQILCTLYNYTNATYCNMSGHYRVY